MADIKNIIFDFGNVLIDLDETATSKRFMEIFTKKGALIVKGSGILEQYEIGAISTETFLETLSHYLKNDTFDQSDILKAWNSILLEIPSYRFKLLTQLKEKYNVFLLSNTNAAHLKWIYDYMLKEHGINDWDTAYFHKTYYSHLMGKRKPNSDIYRHVLVEEGLNPKETLFIDDKKENINAARRLGIECVLHDEQVRPLKEVLAPYL